MVKADDTKTVHREEFWQIKEPCSRYSCFMRRVAMKIMDSRHCVWQRRRYNLLVLVGVAGANPIQFRRCIVEEKI